MHLFSKGSDYELVDMELLLVFFLGGGGGGGGEFQGPLPLYETQVCVVADYILLD